MFNEIKKILKEELRIEESKIVTEAKLSEDLGIDSIDAVELIMKIEDMYQIEVNETKLKDVKTFGQLVDYINELVESK